ncbi:hypothetical protein NQ317_001686 [Molorchus minor]|uniref:Uncharacterized protein n=1 Tax=Molorchus minor TaxID=1323400 RepID=A0ABQ9JI94_9CUCU|nr:hypothetical protein NQ317_001686 [Molorchus minor]
MSKLVVFTLILLISCVFVAGDTSEESNSQSSEEGHSHQHGHGGHGGSDHGGQGGVSPRSGVDHPPQG